jgi:hypothetical protein
MDARLLSSDSLYGWALRNADPPFTGASDINNTVAAFMLIRGPHAYLGWSWVSCSGDCFSKTCPAPPGRQVHYDVTLGGLTDSDYGEPTVRSCERDTEETIFELDLSGSIYLNLVSLL